MFQEGTLHGGTMMSERVLKSQAAMIDERQRFYRIFSALSGADVPCDKKELYWGKRYLAYHREMRLLFRYYSHRLARKPNWYSRFYLIRLFWLVFVSLTRHRLLGKTLKSFHFLRKRE